MTEFFQDLKFGLRMLAKSPGYTLVALATLAIGIGANTAIFSFFDGVLLKPSPFKEADRMVRVLEKPPGGGRNSISTLNYLDWEKQNTVFEYLAGQSWGQVSLTGVETPRMVPSERVRLHFFDVFEGHPLLGRLFVEGEDQVGKDHVAVISHSFWVSQFGSDPAVLGRTVTLDGEPYSIVGVLPGGRYDLTSTKIWRPLSFAPENMTRDFHWFTAWGRLKKGVTLQQASAQMDALATRISHDYPKSNKGWGVGLDSFNSTLVGPDLKQSLYVLMGAVGMVLLIACANLANLVLAKGISRQREVGIRAALGAGRARLIRQFMTESLLLSAVGGGLGLLVAYAGLAALKGIMPQDTIPPNLEVAIDGRVLIFVAVLSVVTGVLFGIVPAVKATRTDLTDSIKEGGMGSGLGPASRRLRGALVVAEVALAFALLGGAGLLVRSLMQMQKERTGFDATNVVTADLPAADKSKLTAAEFTLYYQRLLEAVRAVPGVRDAALTSALPMEGWGYGMSFQIEGDKVVDAANRPDCFFKMVSSSYFRTLAIAVEKGRPFGDRDVKGAPPVTVINATMARKYFPNQNPVGKRILVSEIAFAQTKLGPEIPWEVVGVVADEKVGSFRDGPDDNPGMYVPSAQVPQTGQSIVVRGEKESVVLQRSIRDAVRQVNRDQIVDNMKTLDEIRQESMGGDRFRSTLMVVFAGVALLLSAIGLYGVISYSVVQRTREIGIRTALGATPREIISLILRNGMKLTGLGLLIGVAGTVGLAQALSSMLFDVDKYDPLTLAAVAVAMGAIALVACIIPALRAIRVNPNVALRHE